MPSPDMMACAMLFVVLLITISIVLGAFRDWLWRFREERMEKLGKKIGRGLFLMAVFSLSGCATGRVCLSSSQSYQVKSAMDSALAEMEMVVEKVREHRRAYHPDWDKNKKEKLLDP